MVQNPLLTHGKQQQFWIAVCVVGDGETGSAWGSTPKTVQWVVELVLEIKLSLYSLCSQGSFHFFNPLTDLLLILYEDLQSGMAAAFTQLDHTLRYDRVCSSYLHKYLLRNTLLGHGSGRTF